MVATGPASEGDCLARFHPLIVEWFESRFGQPTAAQLEGWPSIGAGHNTLIAAPTGSGKTLAAFLSCLDDLLRQSLTGPLPAGTQILYVSPLKALSNDIHRNLETPLAEIRELAAKRGVALPPIDVAVRTGDTPASERTKLAKKPPHILVTTPESLYILLTSESGRRALSSVRTVIIDEIHAIAGDKRGAHLSLSLERLEHLLREGGTPAPVRIGLSATQRPIDRIGALLVGERPPPTIVDCGHARDLDLAIELTNDELSAVASNEQLERIYDRIAELVTDHETTLVFVNTRRLVERVSHALEQRLGEEQVVAHHGSLSRRIRLAAEEKLKHGRVKCAVATASLELGIDVGSVDLVVQLGSPRSIATFLQRVGRSGHSLGATPKGRLFALTRDQLCECAALVRALRARILDEIELRPAPLDILAQQMVAAVATGEFGEDELYDLVRSSHSYRSLSRESFDRVLELLAEGPAPHRGRFGAHLHRDQLNRRLRARRGARLAAITCGGAIPDNANYSVVTYPEETPVGSLDEDFAIESSPGDIFLLGNTSWRIRRVETGRVYVEDAAGAPPTIPFWFGEAPSRTVELSDEVSRLRTDIDEKLAENWPLERIASWISDDAAMPPIAGQQLVEYLAAARHSLGCLPSRRQIVAERFFDEAGGMQLVIHSPLGGRVNKAWGLALRKKFCRSFNLELQASATDDGIVISLGPIHSFPLAEVFAYLKSGTARKVLSQAVLGAPVFGVRWRWNVTRALSVLRRRGGKKVAPQILRMRTDDLLSLVFPMQQACLENVVGDIEIPDHPLVEETMRDCLSEFMDIDGLVDLLGEVESGEVTLRTVDSTEPSPLSHELLNANPYAFLDDAPLEERRTRAVSLPFGLRPPEFANDNVIDESAITTAEEEAAPPIRSADELHDALMSVWLSPAMPEHRPLFDELVASGRAVSVEYRHDESNHVGWAAAERAPALTHVLDGRWSPALPELPASLTEALPGEPEAVAVAIIRGHLEQLGPRSPAELASFLGIDESLCIAATATLEGAGSLLRRSTGGVDRFCDRRMLARIHRLTLRRLRREIEPVSAATLMRFLFRWQRLGEGAKLIGGEGVARVIEQLQGFETAAGAWERDLLPNRLYDYDPSWLDSLCHTGEVAWARLSPRTPVASGGKATPTKAAPLSLMLREDLSWLRAASANQTEQAIESLSEQAAAAYRFLEDNGASFLADIVSSLSLSPGEIEDCLWELVGAGLATADGFSCLRVLVDRASGDTRSHFDGARTTAPRSSRWARAVKKARSRDGKRAAHAVRSLPSAAGRWSLLAPPRPEQACPEASARQLLARYGVVFRDLLARESALPPWRELLVALRRLEARGEVRGGRFVNGFVGEQFALPEALDELRSLGEPLRDRPEIVRVSAADPLNLVGVTSPGPKVPAVMTNAILYVNGVAAASLEAGNVVERTPLEDGARVDEELRYVPAPVRVSSAQPPLPI